MFLRFSVVSLLLLMVLGCPDPGDGTLESYPCDACGGDCLIEQFPVESASHVQGGVDYPNRPPVGGDHDPCWAPYGIHETELNDENWVHNLEHGAVVFLYNCPEGCDDERAVLESVAASVTPDTTLVTPYSLMTSRVAAVSWAWRLTMGCADEAQLLDFYESHVGQAPEDTTSAPPGSCM